MEDSTDTTEQTTATFLQRSCRCCGWRGCCVFPHGKITAIALVGASIAWMLIGMGVGGCDMARIDGAAFVPDYYSSSAHHGMLDVPEGIHYGVGPYMRQNVEVTELLLKDGYNQTIIGPHCVAWQPKNTFSRNVLDSTFKFGMSTGIIATACITLGTYVLCAMSCCVHPCGMNCWDIEYTKAFICFMFGFATMNQLLTFSMFGSVIISKYNGRFSIGSWVVIVSMFVCFATAILIRPSKNQKELDTTTDNNLGETSADHVYNENDNTNNSHTAAVNGAGDDNELTVESLPESEDPHYHE